MVALIMVVAVLLGAELPADDLAMLETLRSRHGQPALAAGVARSRDIVLAAAVGTHLVGEGTPVGPGSRFHIGSCTKSMTATLAGMLVERGELDWDARVADVLPAIAGRVRPEYLHVNVGQLLSHQAGIYAATDGADATFRVLSDGLPEDPRRQRLEFAARVLGLEPAFAPGAGFAYSNAGYTVVAAMLEAATGEAWEDLLRARLFEPAGLTGAGLGWPASPSRPAEPRGHYARGDRLTPQPLDDTYQIPPWLAPAGAVHCPIGDFARYAQLHLRGLRGEDGLLRAETVRRLHRRAVDLPLETNAAGLLGFGYGWAQLRTAQGRVLSWHNGSAGTFFAWMVVDPERDVAVVVCTNAGNGEAACAEVTAELLRRYG